MVKFILGRAASGKTYTVLSQISDDVKSGKKPILIVPEQFSFESEKAVLGTLGDSLSQSVSVMSFTRLCDEVERISGGICGRAVTDADKIILMNRAISCSKDSLKVWKNYSASAGFSKSMVDTISEFKLSAVTPGDLSSAAENTDSQSLRAKLLDTAVIYENYNTVLGERFLDPSDKLTKLYYKLETVHYFENKTVYIDSFKGFTGQQFKIIDRIIATAADVTVALTDNQSDSNQFGLFGNIRATKQKIMRIAASHGVTVGQDTRLDTSHYNNTALCDLEMLMAGEKVCPETSEGITICSADSVYDETEFVASNIRRIVRENGARYSDFVVIARDTSAYEEALAGACERCGVNCFIDSRIPLSSLPVAVIIMNAIDTARSMRTENILRFYKSGIEIFTVDELSTLENYTYLWNIDGNAWQNEWTMSPDGLSDIDRNDRPERLQILNELRMRAIKPLLDFKKSYNGTPKKAAAAIIKLLEDIDAKNSMLSLEKEYKNSGNYVYADALRQSWDIMTNILDSTVNCFADADISVRDFSESLRTSVSLATVGVVPQMLDEVTFGAADRIRPSRPKYAFIMGANQGVFPRAASRTGIFAPFERENLISLGIEIPDRTISGAIDEDFLVYSNVCCPTDGLYISYLSGSTATGKCEPSAFVSQIKEVFSPKCVTASAPLSDENIPETEKAAFYQFCRRAYDDKNNAATIAAALADSESAKRIKSVVSAASVPDNSISSEAAHELFGKNLYMSPSKFEEFNSCRFKYFCRYGLKAENIQPVEFNVMQRGTIVHYILERVIGEYGKGVSELTENQISDAVDKFIAEYLDGISGYKEAETEHMKYLVSTIARSSKFVVSRLALEFAQSDFEPVKCELKIGADGDIPDIQIPVENDTKITVTGKVDRVDTWNGYVRIVDYKTGTREFKLPDILFGQNMQMLIYLYAVTKSGIFGQNPAGIFYMPAKRAGDDKKSQRMSGLMVADDDLVTAMEKGNNGEFIPKLPKTYSGKNASFLLNDDFEKIFDYLDLIMKKTAKAILSGNVNANPTDGVKENACKYCDYSAICRMKDSEHLSAESMTNAEVIDEITRQVNESEI